VQIFKILKRFFSTDILSIIFLNCTQWQHILSYDNITEMYKFLKSLHPGGIQTSFVL
jgi:hypothetical protein